MNIEDNNDKQYKPLFGFVVPVYKTPKKYLDFCIQSILNQSYTNIEIILVDDCSPDRCGEYCEDWQSKDSRIKVVHHSENKGLPGARNTGLNYTEADWVAFIDSDDWIDSNMCDSLCNTIKKQKADIYIYSGYRNIENRQIECTPHYSEMKCFSSYQEREAIQSQLFLSQTKKCVNNAFPIQSACTKLFNVNFLREKNVKFTDVKFAEDAIMHLRAIEAANTVVYVPIRLYHYRDTPNSMVNSFRENADKEQLSVMKEMWLFAKEANKNENFYNLMYIFSFMSMQMCLWQKYFNSDNPSPYNKRFRDCERLFKVEPYKSTLRVIKSNLHTLRKNQIVKYFLMKFKCYGILVFLRNKVKS